MYRSPALILWSLHCRSAFLPQNSLQTIIRRQLPRVHFERVFSGHTARPDSPGNARPADTLRDSPSLCTSALGPLAGAFVKGLQTCPHRPVPTASRPLPRRAHTQTSPPRPQLSLPPFPFPSDSKEAAPRPEASPPAGAPAPSRLTARPSPRRLTPPTPTPPPSPAALPASPARSGPSPR